MVGTGDEGYTAVREAWIQAGRPRFFRYDNQTWYTLDRGERFAEWVRKEDRTSFGSTVPGDFGVDGLSEEEGLKRTIGDFGNAWEEQWL